MPPKVSVVMSVYNGSCYLREAVDSILNQTFTDFEFIIIDDCSTEPQVWEILSQYEQQDQRIKLLQNETNLGLTKSLNKGLAKAQGEYIARMDADDISLETRLEKQVKILNEQPNTVLVSCNLDKINSQGEKIGECKRDGAKHIIAWNLLFYNHIGGHSQVLFRKNAAEQVGYYNEDYKYAQDYDLWLRLINLGQIEIIPETLLRYRIGDGRISSRNRDIQSDYVFYCSSQYLSYLTGKKYTKDDSNLIFQFWYKNQLLDNDSLSYVNRALKEIYKAFIDRKLKLFENQEDSNYALQKTLKKELKSQITAKINKIYFMAKSKKKIKSILILCKNRVEWMFL